MTFLWVGLSVAAAGLAVYGYVRGSAACYVAGLLGLALALGPLQMALGGGGAPGRRIKLSMGVFFFLLFLSTAELIGWALETLHPRPEPRPVYTYPEAREDPGGFRRWVGDRARQWPREHLVQPDPRGVNPYVLRPGAEFTRHQSRIRVNQLGFRGRDLAEKGRADFRIVAIGESTTFGLTYWADDHPWPEVLEQLVAERLDCDRRVTVINAGVPGWTLANQLKRLDEDILPLEPDVLVSYHGFNGFHHLLSQLPQVSLRRSERPPERGSRLLGRLEEGVRRAWFRRRYAEARRMETAVTDVDLHQTPYASLYRQLIRRARAAGIEPVLCTFNMAVATASPEEVIRFYEGGVPDVRGRILANQLHSRLILQLGRRLGVRVIDTSPQLDGAYEDAYVDIAHLTQKGRDRLARTIFEGLRPALLAHAQLACRARDQGTGSATESGSSAGAPARLPLAGPRRSRYAGGPR